MNPSWGAVSILTTLITPALVLLVFLRLIFPKLTLAATKDSSLLLVGSLLAVLFNIGTIGEMAIFIGTRISSNGIWEVAALKQIGDVSQLHPLQPAHWLARHLWGSRPDEHDIGYFFWNLHLVPMLIGLTIWLTVFVASTIEQLIQYVPYDDRYRAFRQDFARFYLERPLPKTQSEFKSDHQGRRHLYTRLLDYFRTPLYHPWALLTRTNRWRELLVADVLMEDGDIYSGIFTAYIPEGNGISALSMEYILRYSGETNPSDPKAPRAKNLLKNNGELVIPSSQIKTVHFWEIRRGFHCKIVLAHSSWVEVLKWYLLLAHLFPGFFKKISVAVPSSDMLNAIRTRVLPWLESNRLLLKPKLIEFYFSPTVTKFPT